MHTISEKTTAWLTVTFKDRSGENQAPDSCRYRIDTSMDREVRPWEPIPSSESHEIKLTPTDNSIIDKGNVDIQQNVVTIHATFGADDDERYEQYSYYIKDLRNIN